MSDQYQLALDVADRIGGHLPLLDKRLREDALVMLGTRVVALTDGQVETDLTLIPALLGAAAEAANHIEELKRQMHELNLRHDAAGSELGRAAVVREALEGLETNRGKLVRDLGAMRRHLDLDAIFERYGERVSEQVDLWHLAYAASASMMRTVADERRLLDADTLLETVFEHASTASYEVVIVNAMRFARALLATHPAAERLPLLGAERFRKTASFAADAERGPWAQVVALELCATADPHHAAHHVRERLLDRSARDGMVVRANALRLLGESPGASAQKLQVARLALDDPSEHVRQALARLLSRLSTPAAFAELHRLASEDAPVAVRGVALRELGSAARGNLDAARAAQSAFAAILEQFAAAAIPRASWTLLDIILEELRALAVGPERVFDPVSFVSRLRALLESASLAPGLAERIGSLLLAFEVRSSPKLDELRATFEKALVGMREGDRVQIEFFPETRLTDIEKALAVEVQDGLPVSLNVRGNGRYVLTYGERRRLRLWRLLFELVTPAPDKRMGYAHSRARFAEGEVSVAPLRMGEVTPTRVPGERHLHHELGSWGQFLPRVDDLSAALTLFPRERRIVTSVATLRVRAPTSLWARLVARYRLVTRYAQLASLRDLSLRSREPETRCEFTNAIKRLGFEIIIDNTRGQIASLPYDREPLALRSYLDPAPRLPPAIARASALLPAGIPKWLEELGYTVASPRSNTAWQLAAVVWLVFAGVLFRAAAIRRRIEENLRRIPLRIGGWGSRGKSGSERIKAALFHALRFDVVVKTTGCEAMLIHARRDREARELFLYRPYDKATIWEQERVVSYGARLRAQVLLWECMALQPRFVGILMDEWMQEKIATLTNAYPDHEDIMGPGGEDVARVIGCFMPKAGTVFSAEEQMLPLIREAAKARGTRLVEVGPSDAALLPRDLLARFPYSEHPSNIAMVLAMAEHLGVDREWALVKMADHVIADLGVLKTYPTVSVSGRRLTFSNGMSANERAGFLSNWLRLGFDELDGDRQPSEVSVAVVNNRADRVPRSHVFASVLARDAICDEIVLIGTNLAALQRFIIEHMEDRLSTLSLGDTSDVEAALGRAVGILKQLRLSSERATLEQRVSLLLQSAGVSETAVVAKLATTLDGNQLEAGELEPAKVSEELASPIPDQSATTADGKLADSAEVRRHLERLIGHYASTHATLRAVRAALEAKQPERALDQLREHCRKVWASRIHVVWDSHATGDQVIAQIARCVAPGHHARVLGCQNIKGTGLDFAYRWVSIGQVDAELTRLETEPRSRDLAIRWLRGHGDYGLSDAKFARERVRALAASSAPEWTPHQSALKLLGEHLGRIEAERTQRLAGAPTRSRLSRLLDGVEPFVDHLDSVRRSRRARRIMDDLFEHRMSQARAAVLLRDLVARGKGGWLAKDWLGKEGREAATPPAREAQPSSPSPRS